MSSMTLLTTVPHRTFAEPIAALLRDHGVRAQIKSDDCGGMDPALAFTRGVEILVATEQLHTARFVLDSLEAANEVKEGDSIEDVESKAR